MIPVYSNSQDIQVLQDSINALNAVVDQSVTNQVRMEKDYQSLERKYWDALGSNKKLDDQLREAKRELADKNVEIRDLQQKLQEEKDKTAGLIAQLDQMQSQNLNLQALLDDQARLIRDLQGRLKKSAEKMEEMSLQLGELRRLRLIENATAELKKLTAENYNQDQDPTAILRFLGLTVKEFVKAPFRDDSLREAQRSAFHEVYPNFEKVQKLREFISTTLEQRSLAI